MTKKFLIGLVIAGMFLWVFLMFLLISSLDEFHEKEIDKCWDYIRNKNYTYGSLNKTDYESKLKMWEDSRIQRDFCLDNLRYNLKNIDFNLGFNTTTTYNESILT